MKELQVEFASRVSAELVEAAKTLTQELSSPNQVPVTAEWLQTLIDSDSSQLLVAWVGGEIAGMAVLVMYPTLVNWRAWILTLAVAPRFRRQGVAQELVETALAHSRKRGVNSVWMSTYKRNVAASTAFAKLGGVLSEDYNWYEFELSVGPQ